MQFGGCDALGGAFFRQRRKDLRRGQGLYRLLRRIPLQRGSEDTLQALTTHNKCRKVKEISRIPAAYFSTDFTPQFTPQTTPQFFA